MSLHRTLVTFLCLLSCSVFAQKSTIKGSVVDTLEKRKLVNSSILLIKTSDSTLVSTLRANEKGEFEFKNIQSGTYSLIITYPKMADYFRDLKLGDSSQFNLGPIHMESRALLLNEVTIQAQKQAIRMRGDTIVFQADSFAVKPNANVQELLKRLPGIEVDKDGNIKASGEKVNTVLVDGEEFFGDDPLMATKYLKAKAVDEVQVYDKKSKDTDLTGVEDGKKEKVINIKLKENAKNGYLSTLDANTGTDQFKDYGGMLGIYKSKLKAAVYGNNSTLNKPSKVMGAMSKLKGSEYDVIEVGDDGSTMMISYGNNYDDFSPASGLPELSSYGAHFSNKWLDNKLALKLNYKNNNVESIDRSTSNSQSILPNGTIFIGTSNSTNQSRNHAQTIKNNFDVKLDSLSTLKVSFSADQNTNSGTGSSYSQSLNDLGVFVSQNTAQNEEQRRTNSFNGNINYSRKFKKKGRTLSIDLQPESNNSNGTSTSLNVANYYDANGVINRTDRLDFFRNNTGDQNSVAARFSYTEPLSKRWLLQSAYSFKTISSSSSKLVFDQAKNNARIDSLSNQFDFGNFSNIGKLILQYKVNKVTVSGGVEATQTQFSLKDIDRATDFNRNYVNWAPRTNFNYKISKSTSVAINYYGNTTQPSIGQLQPLRQVSSPLYQFIGNQNLKPSFSNAIDLSFNSYQNKSQQYISLSMNYGFTQNAIVSKRDVDAFNKTTDTYINLNGNKTFNTYFNYSKGFSKLKMYTNFGGGYNRSQDLSIINNQLNTNKSERINLRMSVNYYSNIFQFNYSPSVNFSKNNSSTGTIANGKNYSHNHDISGTVNLPGNMEFNTTVSLSFQPANASFSTPVNVAVWDSYLSKKMLKDQSLEIKVSVSDILKQRNGYNRYVGGNYSNESYQTFIPRYILFGVNYNLSGNFSTEKSKK